MKFWRNFSFRTKMILSNLLIVLIVVSVTAFTTASISSHMALESNRQSLSLITQQSLSSFSSSISNAAKNLYSACAGSGTPSQLYKMRSMDRSSNEYAIAVRELTNLVQFMISYSMPFDGLAVLPDNSESPIYCNAQDQELVRQAQELFSSEEARKNGYGSVQTVCLSDASLWVIRDVYNASPLRHVGRIAARIRKDDLMGINSSSLEQQYSLLFFDSNGKMLLQLGSNGDPELEGASALLQSGADSFSTEKGQYVSCVAENGRWFAVGLQSVSVVSRVQNSLWRNALFAMAGGMLLAFLCTMLASRSLSSGIVKLNESLNRIAQGDWETEIPVQSNDEIGRLSAHFNKATRTTKELLGRVVQEESNKRRAEFMNLEYEYRFLQWQIKPHFIYNALETINALAKIDGNDELCHMIALLSGYFRHNAETMRSLFVTVRQELRSLNQYVEIYRQIYGSTLEVRYLYSEEAGKAYLPTMIVQPLLENALVHGLNPQKEGLIEVHAEITDNVLVIRIEDNGSGMSEETVRKLLEERQENPQNKEERTSLGVQNVRDRLRLLFGDKAFLEITSTLGVGTKVRMVMPLQFSAPENPLHLQA